MKKKDSLMCRVLLFPILKNMQLKFLLIWLLFVLAIALFFVTTSFTSPLSTGKDLDGRSLVFGDGLLPSTDSSEPLLELSLLESDGPGVPTRIKIPKIQVDAIFEHVGLTLTGAMGVPSGPTNVAWFDLGQRPGEYGSAVIAGHFGWKNGIPAVFDHLDELEIGDKVYVIDDKSVTRVFAVTKIRSFDGEADATDIFISTDKQAHLNLVTCKGVWNKSEKSYAERLVVFTTLIKEG